MVKISEFMIGIVLIGMIVGIFGLFMAEANANYNVTYDNSSLDSYNQLSEMSALSQELEEGSNIEERTGTLDLIGGYFTDGYNALLLTKQSFNVFDTMTNSAIDDADLGQAGKILRIGIGTIVLILIVIGVIITAIIKFEL